MKITYNVERLRKTVDDICILTGVSMAIANADHTFLYANASQSYRFCSLLQENPACRERCRQCDQQMMHRADALAAPLSPCAVDADEWIDRRTETTDKKPPAYEGGSSVHR